MNHQLLGYYHEQSRKDRDNYIDVNWNNIEASMKHNFNKCKTCDDQGSPYDTTSVMQYATWAFSKNGKASMLKKGCKNGKGACKLGQYDGLAKSDIEGLNKLYCSGQTPKPGGCSDNPKYGKSCPLWTGKGYCEHTYVNFMKDHCKGSCGFC